MQTTRGLASPFLFSAKIVDFLVGAVPGGIVHYAGGPGPIDSGNERNDVAAGEIGLMVAWAQAQVSVEQRAVLVYCPR